MTSFRIVILFFILPIADLLAQQTFDRSNNSLRLGLGSAVSLNRIEVDVLPSAAFYGGYQIRKSNGRLRIIPAIDLTYAEEVLDIFTNKHYISTAFSTSIDYDLLIVNSSSIYIGLGSGLRVDNELISVCVGRSTECDYRNAMRRSGPFLNMDLGYRYERAEKRSAFEFLTKVFISKYETMIQAIFLIDIKV